MGHGFRGLVACNRRIGTSERIRESFSFGAFPSLQRRGGCGINKKSRSHRSAADGVVAHTQMFQSAFRDVTRERPPRPRLFGTGPFFDGAATPPLQGGEYAHLNSFTATVTTATQTGLVLIFLLQAILGVALLTESNILSFFAMLQSQQLVIPSS